MSLANYMNDFPLKHIPPIWFLSRREHLETYHQELSGLRDKLTRFAGGQNIAAILNAAESLNRLNDQIRAMEDMLESHLSAESSEFDQYNKNDLIRMRELAASLSCNLETIAGHISWGTKADAQIAQVKRNLYPLLDLIQVTLKWLERGT